MQRGKKKRSRSGSFVPRQRKNATTKVSQLKQKLEEIREMNRELVKNDTTLREELSRLRSENMSNERNWMNRLDEHLKNQIPADQITSIRKYLKECHDNMLHFYWSFNELNTLITAIIKPPGEVAEVTTEEERDNPAILRLSSGEREELRELNLLRHKLSRPGASLTTLAEEDLHENTDATACNVSATTAASVSNVSKNRGSHDVRVATPMKMPKTLRRSSIQRRSDSMRPIASPILDHEQRTLSRISKWSENFASTPVAGNQALNVIDNISPTPIDEQYENLSSQTPPTDELSSNGEYNNRQLTMSTCIDLSSIRNFVPKTPRIEDGDDDIEFESTAKLTAKVELMKQRMASSTVPEDLAQQSDKRRSLFRKSRLEPINESGENLEEKRQESPSKKTRGKRKKLVDTVKSRSDSGESTSDTRPKNGELPLKENTCENSRAKRTRIPVKRYAQEQEQALQAKNATVKKRRKK